MDMTSSSEMLDGLLQELETLGFAGETAGKQQQKSSLTRYALLEAAIDCLAQNGYSRTTAQLIAERADLSRGAMLHHYATKRDLIENVIDYICFKRLKDFIDSIRHLSERERVEEQAGLEFYWQSFLSREFQAFLELQIAARTDEELRQYFEPKARRFDRLQREASRVVFPEYRDDWSKLDLSVDFCQAVMQGLVLNRNILEPRSRRVAVRKLFSAAIYAFRNGDLTIETKRETKASAARTHHPDADTAVIGSSDNSQTKPRKYGGRRKKNA